MTTLRDTLARVDCRARNPVIDAMRAHSAYHASRAARPGRPTLFPSGDIPLATASGNPPAQLLDLPWQLRHHAAAADQREWARLHAEYGAGVPDSEARIAMIFEPGLAHRGNDDYLNRCDEWQAGR